MDVKRCRVPAVAGAAGDDPPAARGASPRPEEHRTACRPERDGDRYADGKCFGHGNEETEVQDERGAPGLRAAQDGVLGRRLSGRVQVPKSTML